MRLPVTLRCAAALAAVMQFPSVLYADELMDQARAIFQPIPATPPELADNPSTPEKLALGKMLFFEPRLSQSHNISCASCHNLGLGGADMLETSLGHRSQHGGRNAPTVFNAAFNTAQFWDGRAKDLFDQAGGPIVNPIEMAITKEHVLEQLNSIPGYVKAFRAAFADQGDPISMENVQKSIALFEATLITPNAPFDKYLGGDATALSDDQKAGLQIFMDNGCAGCHDGINIGGGQYQPFGVVEKPGAEFLPPDDTGRFEVTKSVADEYVFKVPTLRNIALSPPYFHTGKSWDLKQAVSVMGTSQLGVEITDAEIDKVVAFLQSLNGELPQVAIPALPPSVATSSRPKP